MKKWTRYTTIALICYLAFWWLIPVGFLYQLMTVYFRFGTQRAKLVSIKIATRV